MFLNQESSVVKMGPLLLQRALSSGHRIAPLTAMFVILQILRLADKENFIILVSKERLQLAAKPLDIGKKN